MSRTATAQPSRFHGLTELAKRRGWRRLRDTERGGAYLSERTVFRDTVTGCLAWRMTCDPSVDENDYYDIPGWNADGSLMTFLSCRAGGTTRWLMNADGSNLRPMPTPDGKPVKSGYWSTRHPDRFYHDLKDERGTHVAVTNPFTGRRRIIVSVHRDLGAMMPPHPSEEWFLFGDRKASKHPGSASMAHVRGEEWFLSGDRKALRQTGSPSMAYVVGLDGSVQEVALEKRWHRLRFTKSADRRIFFNFDDPRTQWSILPDGTGRTSIPDPGGHPDWLPQGRELTYYAAGGIWAIRHDGTGKRRVVELGSGGHGGPCLDGAWFVSDTHGGRYPGSILYLRTDGSGTCHVIFKHMSSCYSHSVLWHPEHHSTHPHPNSSPDGTKTLLNSDLLGQYTDIYVAVNRFPDPPEDLTARTEGAAVVLTWRKPRRCRETRGYHVYRSDESGVNYQRLTTEPVEATEWRGPVGVRPGYYVVTAVEHSGLESRPSNEAFQSGNGNWRGAVRLAIEAEAGETVLPMREFVDQRTASNGYYVACLGGEAAGSLTLGVTVPKAAQYRLWVRVKGNGALSVACDGRPWGPARCSGDEWSWQRVESSPMPLTARGHELRLQPTTGRECIDKVLLTDDRAFVPEGPLSLDGEAPDSPTGVRVTALFPNALRLSWSTVKAADVDHFNVYCGSEADFACGQASLIGSPSEAEFVDWGLALNTTYWYRVTAVDRAGNESPPTAPVQASTPPFEPVRIELKAEGAKLENMTVTEVREAGGRVLRPAARGRGVATWDFELPRDGEYALWGRSTHRKGESAAFDLSIDDRLRVSWRVWGQWERWLWSPAGDMATGSPQLFALQAGKHTLRVRPRTPTSQVAEIVITDDPSWWPVDGMKKRN